MAIKAFSPDYEIADLRRVDWTVFKAAGLRLILVDIDNTLARHGSREPDAYARQVVADIQDAGLEVTVLSNAAGDRAPAFAAELGVEGLGNVMKPSAEKIHMLLRRHKLKPEQAMLVGDQLLTDVWAARNAGILSLKVKPRFKKELWTVRLKRYLEVVIRPFTKRGKTPPSLPCEQAVDSLK